MTEDYEPSNQTAFAQEEPLLENVQSTVPQTESVEPKSPWFKQPKKLLLLLVAVLGALALILMVLFSMESPMIVESEPTPTPKVINPELTPYQQRLERIKAELELANPTKPDLPFPAIDMTIRLDRAERR
ncbi:MAG: hypothetical protein M3Q81_03955 [bacterium]|nr:hypothetical protein [bacterium]